MDGNFKELKYSEIIVKALASDRFSKKKNL